MKRGGQQSSFFKKSDSAFGGTLRNTREGRSRARPLSTKRTMHLVMRSSRAAGPWSFATKGNRLAIEKILKKFSQRYGVKIFSLANVGNHLHVHLRLTNRRLYEPFIRALSAAIAMAITGHSRWNKTLKAGEKFWDYRPFTRVVAAGKRSFLAIRDYLRINRMEGEGTPRRIAEFTVKFARARQEDRARVQRGYG